jgi:HipA-like kinase
LRPRPPGPVAERARIGQNGKVPLAHHAATRYVLPLREGGSLPAIVDTDDSGQYVLKFRGAGQGPKALIAEAIAAGLAQALGLAIPQPAILDLAEGFGANEPDAEIQDLLRWSVGANFGLAYLQGAIGFDPVADRDLVEADLAAAMVWFDAYITNVDRTARNPNILVWHDRLWLIDHGASLYFHHRDGDWQERSRDRFPLIAHHILLSKAGPLRGVDERLRSLLSEDILKAVVRDVPDEWLGEDSKTLKEAYVSYFVDRLAGAPEWLEEAEDARRRI